MINAIYQFLQARAREMALTLPKPAFYSFHDAAIRRADETLSSHAVIKKCRAYLDASQLECAHGLCHCEAVARDAGALVLIEASAKGIHAEELDQLFLAAELAGLLHDTKRKEKDHALLGSIEADKILSAIGIADRYRKFITDAIRNHEAFKEALDSDSVGGRLVSDSLYDADKFRWGPENFTTTLWIMVEDRSTPIETLHQTFRENMKKIERIKDTFRTATGKRHGPEFIDQGITIGNAIFEEMSAILKGDASVNSHPENGL